MARPERLALDRALAADGNDVTLQRLVNGSLVKVAVRAALAGYEPHQLVGNVKQGDRKVVISNTEIANANWPGPPRSGDQIVIDGRAWAVQGCDPISLGGEYVRHNIQIRGM